MPVGTRKGMLGPTVVLAALSLPIMAQAGKMPPATGAHREAVEAHYDPIAQETRVAGHATPDICYSFGLPQVWRAAQEGQAIRLGDAASGAEIEMSLRSARDLRHMPQPDLASRDAAFLQRGYEDLLGRPAQSVSLASSVSGATRWSATWIDASLPSSSREMTVEAIIVPLSQDWVLELSMANSQTQERHDDLVLRLLGGLSVQRGPACRD